jgi:arginyl-tRNA synthetase
VITADLRRALAAAAEAEGLGNPDPGLRPTGIPGQYAASIALATASPQATAKALAAYLDRQPWVATAGITGPGYLSVTVTPEALAAVADRIIAAGPACARSDALAGTEVPAPPAGAALAAATWGKARAALAAQLTASLAAAAGATVAHAQAAERLRPAPDAQPSSSAAPETDPEPAPEAEPEPDPETEVAAAVAFAGPDAVTFTLARAIPGKPLRIDPAEIARRVPANPAYAVRYAHARAASGVRWAVIARGGDSPYPPLSAGARDVFSRETAALLDALSWLPERVAMAARRGRPDEFARYLEDLASFTLDVLTSVPRHVASPANAASPAHPGHGAAPGSDKLGLASAARTALAAGLGLLGVGAPARL